MLICPLVVPEATTAVMSVSDLTVNVCASVPLNWTAVAPVNPEPLMLTVAPIGALLGVKDAIEAVTVNALELVAIPPGPVTATLPVFVPLATTAVICVSELMTNCALIPPKATAVAPVKPEPVMVTLVPTGP